MTAGVAYCRFRAAAIYRCAGACGPLCFIAQIYQFLFSFFPLVIVISLEAFLQTAPLPRQSRNVKSGPSAAIGFISPGDLILFFPSLFDGGKLLYALGGFKSMKCRLQGSVGMSITSQWRFVLVQSNHQDVVFRESGCFESGRRKYQKRK